MHPAPLDNRGQLQHLPLYPSPQTLCVAKRMAAPLNSSTLRCEGKQKAEMLANWCNSVRQLIEKNESQKNVSHVYINIS